LTRKEFYLKEYAKGPVKLDKRMKKVLDFVSNYRGRVSEFLDIGCGDGSFTLFLKETLEAREAFGIEISYAGCESAKEKGIKAFCLDIEEVENFPFEDECFDFIHCGEILEHLFDTDHLLREVYRLLKPEGFCVISTPNLASWYNRLLLLLGFQPYSTSASLQYYWVGKLIKQGSHGGRDHIRVMTLRSFKELLKLHGFEIKKIKGASAPESSLSSHIAPFYSFLGKLFENFPSLSSTLIALIHKGNRQC
jgi:methionine biosynthesis protein MetW